MNEIDVHMSTEPASIIANVPDGMQPIVLARFVEQRIKEASNDKVAAVFVARDGRRLLRMQEILGQLMPGHTIPDVR